jgi:carbon storage regulator
MAADDGDSACEMRKQGGVTQGRRRSPANPLKEERAMLVLSRRLGQRFQIGRDVEITIVKIDRNSVRIGIDAPGNVSIVREEIAIDEIDSRAGRSSSRSDAA